MAFSNKYLTEFASIFAQAWKIETQEDSFAGSVTDLIASGDPLSIEYDTGDDSYNFPVRPSKAVFRVYSSADFQLTDFYSEQDFRLKVKISLAGNLFWQGFVQTGEYSEPYDCPPYPVQITAIDGLNYLKQILFADSVSIVDGVETITYYEGRQFESAVILNILAKVQIIEFTEFVNIYETRMNSGTGDSPFDQCMIDVDVFRGKTCYDALTEILKHYSAVIRQNTSGEMVIYRPKELSGIVYGRKFTAWDTKTAVTSYADQFIDRIGTSSNIKQMPGGDVMIKRASKKVTLNIDYGYKDSWIENHEFKANTFDDVANTWRNWSGADTVPFGQLVDGENEGVGIIHSGGAPGAALVYQTFGTHALATTDLMILQFEYMPFNVSLLNPLHDVIIYLTLAADSGGHWLKIKDAIEAEWSAIASYITWTEEDVQVGKREWKTFKRVISGLPVSGPYTIGLHANASSYCYVGIKNIRFYSTSDEIVQKKFPWYHVAKWKKKLFTLFGSPLPKGDTYPVYHDLQEVVARQYVIENAVAGIDIVEDYALSDVTDTNVDNVIEQFKGALALSAPSLAVAAETFVIDHAGDYLTGGVVVTSSAGVITLESSVKGVDFSGATSITNLTGDLSGSAATIQANVAGTKQKDKVLLFGTSGDANITCNGVTRLIYFDTDHETSAYNFISTYAGAYAAANITATYEVDGSDVYLVFEEISTEGGFTTTAANTSGDLGGTPSTVTSPVEGAKRKDTITLSGSSGTANILCNGVTRGVEIVIITAPSEAWNTRGGSEADPILEIVGAEIALQHSRPKHLVQMNILDNLSGINLITGWTMGEGTYAYESLVAAIDITEMVNSADNGVIYSSQFNVKPQEVISVRMNVTRISGTLPVIYLINNGWTKSYSAALIVGINEIDLISSWEGAASIALLNSATNVSCSMTGVSVIRRPLSIFSNIKDIINGIIGPGGSLISSWNNNGYETLTATGSEITSMINSSGSASAYSSEFNVVSGDIIKVRITVIKTSGTLPTLYIINTGWTLEASSAIYEGMNEIELIPTWTGGAYIAFHNEATNVNCSIEAFVGYRKPRKFAVNRAELDCKNALWNADLIEII